MPQQNPTGGSSTTQAPDRGRVWADEELENVHASTDKATKVRAMFAAIAGSYDLNNRVHSLGRDQAWRRCAVREASVREGDAVLDVACGTGDLTECFARTPASRVVGLDYTREMLDVARDKLGRLPPDRGAGRVEYLEGDAQALPFEDASFDVVSIAFGIRNVERPEEAVGEFARVLRPGGRLIILEFDRPSFPPVRWFNDLYCGWVMPRTATLISRDRSGAYRYLPRSVGAFMPRPELESLIGRSGFTDVRSRALSLGICVCYRGVRSDA